MRGGRKIVINRCYGGFGLSKEAIDKYAELSGKNAGVWVDRGSFPYYKDGDFYERDIPRDDPILVGVVELLGDKASGECADLDIVTIPSNVKWEIEEYDGKEWVSEVHRTW